MQFANIQWQAHINGTNQPYSLDFNDVYFSTDDGLQETEYVFIEHNQLKQRFASLENSHFTIIETGFGSGLNFLAVAAHWLALAPLSAQLNYIGIEKYPLKLADLIRAQNSWPQFSNISNELAQNYTTLKAENNIFCLAEGRIQLDLQVDDVSIALPLISQKTDAWLLDGFAPAKNAEMWSNDVFAHIARLSRIGTTFATFTSASQVRRGLQAVGFDVQKQAGFGKKREMLSGVFLA
jgi:tRNA 5-methylaminomethyl-2-thiouridine biosynthesis bifunctional protein